MTANRTELLSSVEVPTLDGSGQGADLMKTHDDCAAVEWRRLSALSDFQTDDPTVLEGLARIGRLAAEVTGAERGFISLVGKRDMRLIAGFNVPLRVRRREDTICAHTIMQEGLMVVPDASQDARFTGLPDIGGRNGLRFYAATPIETPDGHRIGALGVTDVNPRNDFTASMERALRDLAKLAIERLELHRAGKQLDRELKARKIAQEEAALSASRFRELFDTNPLPMWVLEEKSGAFLDVNQAATRVYGWPREWFRGRTFTDVIDPDDREVASQHYQEKSSETIRQRRHRKADGSLMIVEIHHHELTLQSGRAFCVAVVDVTHQKRAEEVLHRAHIAADMANRAKTEFLANMSHELRTPLNAILGFSELLTAGIGGPMNAKQHEYVGDILASGRHLLTMVNQVLDLAKVEAGMMNLDERAVDLLPLLDECRRLGTMRADGPAPELSIAVPAPMPMVYVDRTRLKQILLNLLSNAVKFTPREGQIVLRVAPLADGLAVAVEDSGVGMTREEIQVALEPFGQIDGTWARSHEGTGLGLPLVKAFCDLHGARLDIDSMPGRGTTVTVLFPPSRILPPKSAPGDFASIPQ